MPYLILAVLLTVVQAVPPIPRQAPDNNGARTGEIKRQGSNNEQPSPEVQSSPIKVGNSAPNENPAHEIAHTNTYQTISVTETAAVSEKSWWDKLYVIFTGALVLAGFAGILYAAKTLKTLKKQTYAIRRQAVLMRRSTIASEKSIRLQEMQLKQWIDVTGIRTRVNNVQGHVPEGTTQTPLFITFDIVNPTGMLVTLNWVIMRINGERQNPRLLNHPLNPSTDPLSINTSILLEGERLEKYKRYSLTFPVIVYVGFTDAFNKPRKEHFSCVCVCGPPASTRVSAYEGTIPDENIQESDKNPT